MIEKDLQDAIQAAWAADEWLGDTSHVKALVHEGTGHNNDYPYVVFMLDGDSSHNSQRTTHDMRLEFMAFAENEASAWGIVERIAETFDGNALTDAAFLKPRQARPAKVEPDTDQRWIGLIIFEMKIA